MIGFILLVILFFLILLIYKLKDTSEFYTIKEKKAICFLMTKYSERYLKSIEEKITENDLKLYDFYACIDKTNTVPKIIDKNSKLRYILVDANEASSKGFKNSVLWCQGRACSRDKALYYFSSVNLYPYVWFVEDDVLFKDFSSLSSLDKKYGNLDLLVRSHHPRTERAKEPLNWHWPMIVDKVKAPWAYSNDICIVRLSSTLLGFIKSFAEKNGYLFIDEALFNTIAMHHLLTIGTVPEFEEILCCSDPPSNQKPLKKGFFYHPVKTPELQSVYVFEN
jgi:hypothetical protein